jgi:hypothetical protein
MRNESYFDLPQFESIPAQHIFGFAVSSGLKTRADIQIPSTYPGVLPFRSALGLESTTSSQGQHRDSKGGVLHRAQQVTNFQTEVSAVL